MLLKAHLFNLYDIVDITVAACVEVDETIHELDDDDVHADYYRLVGLLPGRAKEPMLDFDNLADALYTKSILMAAINGQVDSGFVRNINKRNQKEIEANEYDEVL